MKKNSFTSFNLKKISKLISNYCFPKQILYEILFCYFFLTHKTQKGELKLFSIMLQNFYHYPPLVDIVLFMIMII